MLHIRAWRKLAGLTLKQAAEAVGRHLSAISKWEEGSVSPTARELETLAKRYGVHPGWFFFDPEEFTPVRRDSHAMIAALQNVDPMAYAMASLDPEVAHKLTDCLRVIRTTPDNYHVSWISVGTTTADFAAQLAQRDI